MVLYVLDVAPTLDSGIRRLVAEGRYRDSAHAAEVALETLLRLHGQVGAELPRAPTILTPSVAAQEASVAAVHAVMRTRPLGNTPTFPAAKLDDSLLWGVPRCLPLKVVMRTLAQGPPEGEDLQTFLRRLRPVAFEMGAYLGDMDKRQKHKFGDHIGAGFPTNKEDAEASWVRFTEQYVYVSRRKGVPDGAAYRLGLMTLVEDKVRLTPLGLRLALAPSPLEAMPSSLDAPLSHEETAIFLEAFANHPEGGHVRAFLSAVHSGAVTPPEVLEKIRPFYDRLRGEVDMSEAYANSLRGSLAGRLKELQLIAVARHGTQVSYSLTPAGEKALATLGGA